MVGGKGMESKAVICILFLSKLGAGKSDVPSLLGGKRHSPVNFMFSQGWCSSASPMCFSLASPWGPVLKKGWKSNEQCTRRAHKTKNNKQVFPQACYPGFLLFTPMNLAFLKQSFLLTSYREIILPSLNVWCIYIYFKPRSGFELGPKCWC